LSEQLIDRVQRNALVSCAVMAAAAPAIAHDWRAGLAVLGGGALIAISFLAIRGGLDDMAVRRRAGRGLLKIAGRYALLAFLAYVMIARLRLPPLGLIAGASSLAAAAGVEALRILWKNTRY
jgi:hypothetical protein